MRASITAARISTTDGHNVQNEVDRITAMVLAKVTQRIKVMEEVSPSYLPALTTSSAVYYGVYGTKRLVSGSTMALARGIRNSNSATVDLGASADAISPWSIKDIRGSGTNAKIDKWYDQSGNGRDFTQTTAAQRPVMHEDSLINGIPAMTFPQSEAGVDRLSNFVSPAFSLSREDFTLFMVIDPTVSMKNQSYIRFEKAGPTPIAMNLFHGYGVDNGRVAVNQDAVIQQTHKFIQSSPHLFVIKGTAGVLTLYFDDTSVALTTSAATMILFYIGCDPTANLFANFRASALVFVDKATNAADDTAISAVLRRRFRLSTDYDATLVYSGTSRTVAGQADNAFTKIFYEQKQFARNYRIYNLGQDGAALSTTLTNFASREATVYDSSRPMIYIIDDAINDLGGLGASSVPATIYSSPITGLVNAAKALGSNVSTVVRTDLPQDSSNGTYAIASATINANRVTLNGLKLANSAGATVVTDTAAFSTMGVYPTNPDDATKYGDKLHLTALGNQLLASVNAAGIEGISLP
jgi:hypothetical protein